MLVCRNLVAVFFSTVLLHGVYGTVDISGSAKVGIFFQHKIDVSHFVSNENLSKVHFIASASGDPDLPTWLRLEQEKPSEPAILYGTPPGDSPEVVNLEITGWDKKTYNTQRRKMEINVDHTEEVPRYQVELLITNHDLDEFLQNNESSRFVKKVKDACWQPDGGPQVTLVESALSRGGRIPLPINNRKKMVYVAVGGRNRYRVFETAKPNCVKQCSLAPYVIDWSCGASRLIDMEKLSSNGSAANMTTGERFTDSVYIPHDYDASGRDFKVLFILILILPIVIVLLIAALLACIMFGYREGRQHRDADTPRSQLHHHKSILRATFQLRQLSHQNGEPGNRSPPPATSSVEQPRQTSTPYARDPHQQVQDDKPDGPRGAPPPYQLPPAAGINVSSPDGANRYYPSKDQSRRQRPPPFMNSSDLQ